MGSITETKSMDMDRAIIKHLLRLSMEGEWKEVVKIYRANPMVHKAKITRSGDTALHIAVSDHQEDIVEQLVRIIQDSNEDALRIAVSEDHEVQERVLIIQDSNDAEQRERKKSGAKEVLEIKNERGNTPLHIAASIGSVWLCDLIAEVDSSLVGARNDDNETPFFIAALCGRKEAFFCLHKICATNKGYDYCRRKDGDTILHCAIAGDYFDLAFQIIHLYPKLVNSVNERGFSPLHQLASKAYAFRSGSDPGICYKFIYHCISVDVLKLTAETTLNDKKLRIYGETYGKCIELFIFFWLKVQVGFSSLQCKKEKKKRKEPDAENPQGFQDTNGPRLFPANYETCFEIFMFPFKVMLVILGFFWDKVVIHGLGYPCIRIGRIRASKEKHVWSVMIMNELLTSTKHYEYENSGTNPGQQATSLTDDETQRFNALDEEHIRDQKQTPSTFQSQSVETNQEDKKNNGKDYKDIQNNPVHTFLTEVLAGRYGNNWLEKVKNYLEGEKDTSRNTKGETPILIAAKKGVTEMVEEILKIFPEAIHDMNTDKKNIVLLAVENRQPHVYKLLLDRPILKENIFGKVDKKGNSALHLAAKLGDKSWMIPGAALQMQWEMKWFEFVAKSMPPQFFPRENNEGKNPTDIFTETHKDLLENGGNWLNGVSQYCSVVAGLLVTVAYSTATTVPGGVKGKEGTPILEHFRAFDVFAVWSLLAFYSSLSAVVMFLSILTSGYQLIDFRRTVFIKLLLGLTSLYVSIASTLASFTAGHYFILKDTLKQTAAPVYSTTCLLVTMFAIAQFPLYVKVIWATVKKVPDRSVKNVLHYDR